MFSKIEFIKHSLAEDIGRGDLFSLVSDSDDIFTANIISKDSGILSGCEYIKYFEDICECKIVFVKNDGDVLSHSDIILSIQAKANVLLSIERVILNILQHSSGIATKTYQIKKLLDKTDIKLLDTRKTRPFLREFEKYSTRVGGAINHRLGLDDCLMIKDTHLMTIPNLKEFVQKARKKIPWTSKIECECETVEFAKEAMDSGCDIIMCDNMNIEQIKEVVDCRDNNFNNVLIEVSGNITKDNIEKYKKVNIDAISSGSLVHQATWLDFSMKVILK
jgi:nicotinate-nucleotide pyrophosphorylase (carboxylating)